MLKNIFRPGVLFVDMKNLTGDWIDPKRSFLHIIPPRCTRWSLHINLLHQISHMEFWWVVAARGYFFEIINCSLKTSFFHFPEYQMLSVLIKRWAQPHSPFRALFSPDRYECILKKFPGVRIANSGVPAPNVLKFQHLASKHWTTGKPSCAFLRSYNFCSLVSGSQTISPRSVWNPHLIWSE